MKKMYTAVIFMMLISSLSSDLTAFSRPEDHVVIRGATFLKIQNTLINNIRVYSYRKNALGPIPFQIDKLNVDGEYLFSINDEKEKMQERKDALEKALSKNNRPESELNELKRKAGWVEKMDIFDAEDELVFMAWDIGEKAGKNILPEADNIEEIQIINPSDSSTGYVYAAVYKNSPPPLSAKKYIDYNLENDEVIADYYILKFYKDRPHEFSKTIPRSADGTPMENQLDLFHSRIKLDVKFFVTVNFNEKNIKGKILAHKTGPVRVIKRLHCWVELLFIKVTPYMIMDMVFYPNGAICPTVVDCPFNPATLLNKGSQVIIAQDFNNSIKGARLYTAKTSDPLIFDGKMSDKEKSADLTDCDWYVLYSKTGGVFLQIVWSEKLKYIKNDLIYIDDDSLIDDAENTPGKHLIGFISDIIQFPKGMQKFYMNMYLTRDWKAGQEMRYIDINAHPLKTKTIILK